MSNFLIPPPKKKIIQIMGGGILKNIHPWQKNIQGNSFIIQKLLLYLSKRKASKSFFNLKTFPSTFLTQVTVGPSEVTLVPSFFT